MLDYAYSKQYLRRLLVLLTYWGMMSPDVVLLYVGRHFIVVSFYNRKYTIDAFCPYTTLFRGFPQILRRL